MATKTKNFSELRERARRADPDWDANVTEHERAMRDALALAELRESRKVTQIQLATQLGISQGNVSRVEGRRDVYLSTLRDYVEALGGHLEIAAVFNDGRVGVSVGPNHPDNADDGVDQSSTRRPKRRPGVGALPTSKRTASPVTTARHIPSVRAGSRAEQAVAKIIEQPGITASELAKAMDIAPNYLYRVLPLLQKQAKVAKRGRGYHPATEPETAASADTDDA
jgi:DNA-binding XRE family transcriptional regulator